MTRRAACTVLAVLMGLGSCGRSGGGRQDASGPRAGRDGEVMEIRERTLGTQELPGVLWGRWRRGRTRFVATTDPERAAAREIVVALLRAAREHAGAGIERLQRAAQAAGLSIERWSVNGARFVALVESAGRARGAGAYVFRLGAPAAAGASPEIVLQSPHGDHDAGTGEIAAAMFFETGSAGRARALFTSTVHRYVDEQGNKTKRAGSPADVCHNAGHLFSIATLAVASAGPVEVVQLHGFDGEGGDRTGAAMIVSAGRSSGPTARTTALARSLAASFGEGVLLYPDDTRELGGTTNAQGRLLRDVAGAEFVHLEMSVPTRESLRSDPARRQTLARILLGADPGEGSTR